MTRLVVVDATPLGPEPSGSRRRLVEVLRHLPGLLPDDVFEVHWARDGCGPPEDLVADNLVHARVEASCRGGARRWLRRAHQLRRRHAVARFTHLLTDHGPIVLPARVRNLVTVHDTRFLHGYGGFLRGLYGRWRYGAVLRQAAAVVAVAPGIARELVERYALQPARVHVAANAALDAMRPMPGPRQGALLASRDEPRKARGAAVAAAREAGVPLTIVDDVQDDDVLRAHYGRARWLLAPSVFEGYDLPVVEALACGTPVIASDIPAHRDLVELGARGIVLVTAPRREGGGWVWPEAVAALRGTPPDEVAAPPQTWRAAAAVLARLIAEA